MSRYRFIVGATLAALEQDLNRIAAGDPDLELRQVLVAPGTGFVAVVEHGPPPEQVHHPEAEQRPEPAHKQEPQRKPRKSSGGRF